MTKIVFVLALFAYSAVATVVKSHSGSASIPKWRYKSDCFKSKPVTGLLQYVPGTGIADFEPFSTVLKDGFRGIDCVMDYMYNHGDKFGDNKHDYKLESVSNVSIVHYEAHVRKEDRQPMTQDRCFEFCRTVPNMGFFGLMNGRSCYCAPYYKKMAGDSSQCDANCPGDPTMICGGKSKSSIFSMHNCDSTERDLTDATMAASALAKSMDRNIATAKTLSKGLQKDATSLQKKFGAVGDSGTTGLMQQAKVAAGELVHAAEDLEPISKELKGHSSDAKSVKDFQNSKQVIKAERIMGAAKLTVARGTAANEELEKLIGLASPSSKVAESSDLLIAPVCAEKEGASCKCDGDVYFAKKFEQGKPGKGDVASLQSMVTAGLYSRKTVFGKIKCSNDEIGPDPAPGFSKHCFCVKKANPAKSANQYMNIMHLVDTNYEKKPNTCSGELVGTPIIGETVDGCASACSADNQNCVGFQYFADNEQNPKTASGRLCFLFSNFKTVTYYAGCGRSFLQTSGVQACANKEGDSCSCDGDVYFGKKFKNSLKKKGDVSPGSGDVASLGEMRRDGNYTKRTIYGSIECSNDKLGPDPAPGFSKRCLCEKRSRVACYAKLQRFEGTSLKPDESGNCKDCLKEATKADRCFK